MNKFEQIAWKYYTPNIVLPIAGLSFVWFFLAAPFSKYIGLWSFVIGLVPLLCTAAWSLKILSIEE